MKENEKLYVERRDVIVRHERTEREGAETVSKGGMGGGGTLHEAVAWTYCALMGSLSFLWLFFFAVEEQY